MSLLVVKTTEHHYQQGRIEGKLSIQMKLDSHILTE